MRLFHKLSWMVSLGCGVTAAFAVNPFADKDKVNIVDAGVALPKPVNAAKTAPAQPIDKRVSLSIVSAAQSSSIANAGKPTQGAGGWDQKVLQVDVQPASSTQSAQSMPAWNPREVRGLTSASRDIGDQTPSHAFIDVIVVDNERRKLLLGCGGQDRVQVEIKLDFADAWHLKCPGNTYRLMVVDVRQANPPRPPTPFPDIPLIEITQIPSPR